MKPRMSVGRCCCGGGGVPTPGCEICNLSTCGWTTDGSNEISNTEHPQGLAHGVINAQTSFSGLTDGITLLWDYENTSTNNAAVVRKNAANLILELFEDGVLNSTQTWTPIAQPTLVDVCLEFANGAQYLSVTDGLNVWAIEGTIPEGTSPKVGYSLNNVAINTFNWTQHPDDVATCPRCGVPCPDCCTGAVSREWELQLNGPLVNNYFDNCVSLNGSYFLRNPLGLDDCYWVLVFVDYGTYDESEPLCGPRTADWRFELRLENIAGSCRLQLDAFASYPVSPEETCDGVGAVYRSGFGSVDEFCSGEHTLTLDNIPEHCTGFPATVTVKAV